MTSTFSMRASLAVITLLVFSTTIHAHTWVEELNLIASNGTFVGNPGYTRGWIPRTAPGWSDFVAENKLLGNLTGPMCKAQQTLGNYTAQYPALSAAPNDQVALRYLENGHVTLFTVQQGKPLGRGTVFIYGTTKPSPDDTYLNVHRVWNAAGTGGNGNGKLLATRPFDDGRCYQINDAPVSTQRQAQFNYNSEVWCQADFQIPADAPTTGLYTVYWVWEWPFLYSNGAIQSNESYTSCMDISMTPNAVPNAGSFDSTQVTGSGVMSAGIQAYSTTEFSVNPTAYPQVAPDNPNPIPAPPGVEPPSQDPAAAAAAAPSTATSAAASPLAVSPAAAPSSVSNANEGAKMVTVTVTEPAVTTVTVTAASIATSATQNQTPVASSASSPAPSPSSAAIVAADKPAVTPFLAPSKRSVSVRGRAVFV
jgi:hypothetical protein